MKHINEATIQAFLDGEMSDQATANASQHLAVCGVCANALLEAEAQQAEVNFAFAAEASAPVPSQRIWARIENEIDFLGASDRDEIVKVKTKLFWQHWGMFSMPAQFAFAGGLAAVVFASFFAIQVLRQTEPNPDDVAVKYNPDILNSNSTENVGDISATPKINETDLATSTNIPPRRVKAVSQPKIKQPERINPKSKIQNLKSNQVLPEERGYLNSIAELSKAVSTGDEFVMRPSFRVDYERNLAVTNEAISAMQKQVRRNPGDENAKRILFASYQNKIELLNTVAEKSQMIASLK